jgi:hypothetical protein
MLWFYEVINDFLKKAILFGCFQTGGWLSSKDCYWNAETFSAKSYTPNHC